MTKGQEAVDVLADGPVYRFADWPIASIPKGPGVYTVWRADEFLYVGIAGREGARRDPKGVWGRLNSHASGRRSGDQFCVYVCDRLILLTLEGRLRDVADGRLSLDATTRGFIRRELSFRVLATADYSEAQRLETRIKRVGLPGSGQPLLNPRNASD